MRSSACRSGESTLPACASHCILMAAGALSAHGYMQASTVVLLSVLACLLADGLWFWLGQKWGSQVMRLLRRLTADPRRCSRDAHDRFSLRAPLVVCGQVQTRTRWPHSATCRR